jgi:hypothetical protein
LLPVALQSSGHALVPSLPEEDWSMPMATVPKKVWTLAELHSLPDDGNRYELVHGELFVTPAPTYEHEAIAAALARARAVRDRQ